MTTSAPSPSPAAWSQSLADGAAGIALRDAVAAGAGTNCRPGARASITTMTRFPLNAGIGASLYQGAPAVAFVLHIASQPWAETAQHILDQHIENLTTARLTLARRRMERGEPPRPAEYDLISGLTGLGAYHLSRHDTAPITADVLRYLIALTHPLSTPGGPLPGWWSATGPNGNTEGRWAGGHANLGVAHGISGVLTLLSTAMARGTEIAGQAAAINVICEFLDCWQQGNGQHAWWPETICRSEYNIGTVLQAGPGRPSWCYGTPGHARAQQLAALALGDPARTELAEHSLIGCLSDPRQLSQLTDATLCHGWAGTLLTTCRVARDAHGNAALNHAITHLRAALKNHLHRNGHPNAPGLLRGRAGIDLALISTTAECPASAPWDMSMLLASEPLSPLPTDKADEHHD